jgi:hypothetical protein
VFAGTGALFGGDDGTKLKDIWDGMSWTIMVVEAADPVPWTKPEDLPFNKDKPLPQVGGLFKDTFHAAMGDGSVRRISKNVDPIVLRALITSRGGEVISADAF